jgi:DNA-binding response OmpR family regulator
MTSPLRILIIDDCDLHREMFEEILEDFQTRSATDGWTGLKQARAFRPHLTLLDVDMPGLDGLETCRRMRADPDLGDTGILMVSGRSSPEEKRAGLEAGADGYLVKPFGEGDLLAMVDALLNACSRSVHRQPTGSGP